MAKVNEFGSEQGIAERLLFWRDTLTKNTNYPFPGLGFVADLECAARLLGGDVPQPIQISEYDL